MLLNGLLCADVLLSSVALTHYSLIHNVSVVLDEGIVCVQATTLCGV